MNEGPKKTIADIQRSMVVLAGDLTNKQLEKLNDAEKIFYELQKDFEKKSGANNGTTDWAD